jgi:hypothetical protein
LVKNLLIIFPFKKKKLLINLKITLWVLMLLPKKKNLRPTFLLSLDPVTTSPPSPLLPLGKP